MDQSAAKLQIEAPSSSEIGKQVSAELTTRPGYILSALSAQVTGLHFVGTCRPIGQLFRLAMRTTLSVTGSGHPTRPLAGISDGPDQWRR